MILWVASYPRSGNTLLRIMLKEVFGCKTYARRPHPAAPAGWSLAIREVSGIVPLQSTWPEAYARMSEMDEVCLVKTHHPPEDTAKAVYVARNGFAAAISYQYYLRDLHQKSFSLEEIILGKPPVGSWGTHLDAWQPFDRPNTLLLTYEDLVHKPDDQITRLSEFCGLQPQKPWINEFDKLHARVPSFFRKGQTGDASREFSQAEKDLFWSLHGDWMQRLGYAPENFVPAKGLPELRKTLMERARASVSAQNDSPPRTFSLRRMIAAALRKAHIGS